MNDDGELTDCSHTHKLVSTVAIHVTGILGLTADDLDTRTKWPKFAAVDATENANRRARKNEVCSVGCEQIAAPVAIKVRECARQAVSGRRLRRRVVPPDLFLGTGEAAQDQACGNREPSNCQSRIQRATEGMPVLVTRYSM